VRAETVSACFFYALFRESAKLRQYAATATTTEGAALKAEQQRVSRFAVLIDTDNTSPQIAGGLFEEVAKFGEASVRRIYGDFSGGQLKSLADILQRHAIDPYQQFAYTKGKNASDIALVIDAMDLLHSGRFDGFVWCPPTAILPGSPPGCANRAPTSTASGRRKRRRVFARPAAASSTPRTCCRRNRSLPARRRRRNKNHCSRRAPRFQFWKRLFHKSTVSTGG
jgi:NYN domain